MSTNKSNGDSAGVIFFGIIVFILWFFGVITL